MLEHVAVQVHEFFDLAALKRRNYRLDWLLNEHCVEAVLVANCLEDV